MPVSEDCQTLICHTDGDKYIKRQVRYIIAKIDDKEDSKLDRNCTIFRTINGRSIRIDSNNTIAWGIVDFDENSEDMNQLYNLIKNDKFVHIPSDYDLETHCCYSPVKSYRTTETSDIVEIARYCYGKLGKPNKVVIFKDVVTR